MGCLRMSSHWEEHPSPQFCPSSSQSFQFFILETLMLASPVGKKIRGLVLRYRSKEFASEFYGTDARIWLK